MQELLQAEKKLQEAYEAFYDLQYNIPWATDYQRHQVDAEIRYCEEQYNEAFNGFIACYF